ncbi:hypothetical protein EJ06DRAFT_240184 [Trichodelitschia bisporula]|uniref:Uncharacterized protein n=1 Tax=Trichodelitschia bisporula TaxID=703511 RepID=A0A6G1HKR3_9PEZI|nr:hypothetical protein EJ06DRAFT_240184 [Trichodelitschia bisporula]
MAAYVSNHVSQSREPNHSLLQMCTRSCSTPYLISSYPQKPKCCFLGKRLKRVDAQMLTSSVGLSHRAPHGLGLAFWNNGSKLSCRGCQALVLAGRSFRSVPQVAQGCLCTVDLVLVTPRPEMSTWTAFSTLRHPLTMLMRTNSGIGNLEYEVMQGTQPHASSQENGKLKSSKSRKRCICQN